MGSLSEEWGCDASYATSVVDRLESRGLAERRAVYRGAEGCLVLRDPSPPPPVAVAATAGQPGPSLLPPIAGPTVVEPADPALKAALDRAFTETPSPPHRATKAVVVLRDGSAWDPIGKVYKRLELGDSEYLPAYFAAAAAAASGGGR